MQKPPVQSLSQVTDLLIGIRTYLIVEQRTIGWYKVLPINKVPDVNNYNIIHTSPMCDSVSKRTHVAIHSGLSVIECNYLQYKLDSYTLAHAGLDRVRLYKRGHISVASAASIPTVALYNNILTLTTTINGRQLYYYQVPYLSGEDGPLMYDTYPILKLDSTWCSIYDLTNLQQHMPSDHVAEVVEVAKEITDSVPFDLSTLDLYASGPLGEK